MNEQVLIFLAKYQEMRRLKAEYVKNSNRFTLAKYMKLEYINLFTITHKFNIKAAGGGLYFFE